MIEDQSALLTGEHPDPQQRFTRSHTDVPAESTTLELNPGQVGVEQMIVGAAMAFSSVFVVTNSLRLRRFQPAHLPIGSNDV